MEDKKPTAAETDKSPASVSSRWTLCDECSRLNLMNPLSKEHDCDTGDPDECSVNARIGLKWSLYLWSINTCTLCSLLAESLGRLTSTNFYKREISFAHKFKLFHTCSHAKNETGCNISKWMEILAPQTLLHVYLRHVSHYLVVQPREPF